MAESIKLFHTSFRLLNASLSTAIVDFLGNEII